MTGWIIICIMAAVIAAGARAADKWAYLRNSKVRMGVWFGLLAILANTFSADIGGLGISAGLRASPPMIAGFFFGPVPAVIAGAIAAVERMMTPLWGVGASTWGRCSVATFCVAIYAAALGRWIFEGKRPPVAAAVVAAAFGEVLHLMFNGAFGMGNVAETIEILLASITPMAVGSAITAALTSVALGSWRGWRYNLSPFAISFVLFAMASGIVAFVSSEHADSQSAMMLRKAIADVESNIDNQIGYLLHSNASALAAKIGKAEAIPAETLDAWAETYNVDEINVIGTNGVILASNDPAVKPGTENIFHFEATKKSYAELLAGRCDFVKQEFRRSISNPSLSFKYIAVKLPAGGILQFGYGWNRLETQLEKFFFPLLEGAGVGESGFYIFADGDGVVAEPVTWHPDAEGKTLAEIGLGADAAGGTAPGSLFNARIFGVQSRCICYDKIGSWRIYAVMPLVESQGPAVLIALVAILIFFIMCVVFRLVLIRFRNAQEKIDALRADEEARRAADMDLARRIQTSDLNMSFPDNEDYRIFASMRPAREVGGDFYDFYTLEDGRLVVTIADVSGKGVPAAFFMMRAKAEIKHRMYGEKSLVAALQSANDRLVVHNDAEMFVTVWIGVYDPATGILEYASAGHNPPLVRHADGSVEWLRIRPVPPLASIDGIKFRSQTAQLSEGDTLFMYTDGVTEAQNAAHELYGDKRLEDAFRRAEGMAISEITADVDLFVGGAEQADDITMLSLGIRKRKTAAASSRG